MFHLEDRSALGVEEKPEDKKNDEKAREIIAAAQSKSREMRKAAQDFVDDIMAKADDSLMSSLSDLRQTRSVLRQQRQVATIKPAEMQEDEE